MNLVVLNNNNIGPEENSLIETVKEKSKGNENLNNIFVNYQNLINNEKTSNYQFSNNISDHSFLKRKREMEISEIEEYKNIFGKKNSNEEYDESSNDYNKLYLIEKKNNNNQDSYMNIPDKINDLNIFNIQIYKENYDKYKNHKFEEPPFISFNEIYLKIKSNFEI